MTYESGRFSGGDDHFSPRKARNWQRVVIISYLFSLLPAIFFLSFSLREYGDTFSWSEGISHGTAVAGPASIIPSSDKIAEAQGALVSTGSFAGLYLVISTALLIGAVKAKAWKRRRELTAYCSLTATAFFLLVGIAFFSCYIWCGISMWTLGQ
jgi:hypothetical protein